MINHNMTVGVVSAMESELEYIRENLEDAVVETFAQLKYYSGRYGGVKVVLCNCGVGKVNAAMHTQIMIDRYDPDVIINNGVAGALAETLDVFDVVVGTEFVYHDMQDFILEQFEPLEKVYYADAELVGLFRKLGGDFVYGRIASGEQFISVKEEKLRIRERTNALCVEMESAAIAHVAYLNDKKYAAVRVISDNADNNAQISFDEFEKKAAKDSAELMLRLIAGLKDA